IVSPDKTSQLIEAIKENKIDIVLLNTFGYVLAAYDAPIEPLLVVSNNGNQPTAYQSCILAHAGTQITSTQMLKEKASDLVFNFVKSSSTSGHLVPRLYLNSMSLQPEYFFNDIAFAGSHYKLAEKINTGEAQVGACSYTDLQKWVTEGKLDENNFKVLWTSKPIVNGPISIKKSLSPNNKQAIKSAFLALPKEKKELYQQLSKIWHNVQPGSTLIEAQDDLYNPIREMADSMEELSILVGLYSE
ncbi:MAG: phosphate/phosphite/phosphonate ABC transporter substrate-binding protein, partial [Bacteroidota bacterium]